jgi:hypothetical protein
MTLLADDHPGARHPSNLFFPARMRTSLRRPALNGEIRQVAVGTLREYLTAWRTISRAEGDLSDEQGVAFASFDADNQPIGYAEASAKACGRWTLRIACHNECTLEELRALLESVAGAIRESGGESIETAIGYDSNLSLQLFRESGLPVRSLLSFGGEAALVLMIGDADGRYAPGAPSRNASISDEKSSTMGR